MSGVTSSRSHHRLVEQRVELACLHLLSKFPSAVVDGLVPTLDDVIRYLIMVEDLVDQIPRDVPIRWMMGRPRARRSGRSS